MTMPLRAFVVDDEALAVKRLLRLLAATRRTTIAGTATDPAAALAALATIDVDVLFLDIEMPGLTGLELLRHLRNPPRVIFTTAFSQYAVQAFEANSIDYLLKPIAPARLERALDKVEGTTADHRRALENALRQIDAALKGGGPASLDRIASRVGDHVQVIEVSRVTHFFADGKLTYAATAPRPAMVDFTLAELEARLDPRKFLRIHRSAIVNLSCVAEVRSLTGATVVRLRDPKGTEVPVSRDRLAALKARLAL